MPRFYFDLQDNDGLVIDDDDVELDVDAVQNEAAFTMADAVRDKLRGPAKAGEIAVQVRDDVGKIMRFRVAIEMQIERKTELRRPV
jgi:hypothetical protein